MEINREVIQKEINRWDPEDLFDSCYPAPEDEYTTEINIICEQLQKHERVDEKFLADIISTTFERTFSSDFSYRRKECLAVAKRILRDGGNHASDSKNTNWKKIPVLR